MLPSGCCVACQRAQAWQGPQWVHTTESFGELAVPWCGHFGGFAGLPALPAQTVEKWISKHALTIRATRATFISDTSGPDEVPPVSRTIFPALVPVMGRAHASVQSHPHGGRHALMSRKASSQPACLYYTRPQWPASNVVPSPSLIVLIPRRHGGTSAGSKYTACHDPIHGQDAERKDRT